MWAKLSEQSYQRRENHQSHARRDQARDLTRHVRHDQHRNHQQQAPDCCHGKARQSLLMPDITICLVATDIAELRIGVIFGERQHATGKDVVRYEPGRLEDSALKGVCGPHEEWVFFVAAQSALFHEVEIADGITLRTVSGSPFSTRWKVWQLTVPAQQNGKWWEPFEFCNKLRLSVHVSYVARNVVLQLAYCQVLEGAEVKYRRFGFSIVVAACQCVEEVDFAGVEKLG
jgi:hypothetical protein